jgi:peptidyl-prolyl cis-trans isomerase B (cyclophilin B)
MSQLERAAVAQWPQAKPKRHTQRTAAQPQQHSSHARNAPGRTRSRSRKQALATIAGFSPSPPMQAIITTPHGDITINLFDKTATNTVANFVKLAQSGFYNELAFHRVINNFMIQGGCPNSKAGAAGIPGTGGPGYKIKCETSGGNQRHDRGVLSMAHAGKDTGGSQFFICHSRRNTAHLDRNHTCFGKVVQGLEVIDAIKAGDRITEVVLED